ncbi:MAG: hypothetical protein QOF42_141 [Gammaproteobacteria bacterium]|nr:hypothetical protein [Gammaproteobacteria bacterium]
MADRNHGETPRSPIEVQKALKGVSYPADKQTLLETARSNGADEDVTAALEALPDGEYASPAEVSKGVGNED